LAEEGVVDEGSSGDRRSRSYEGLSNSCTMRYPVLLCSHSGPRERFIYRRYLSHSSGSLRSQTLNHGMKRDESIAIFGTLKVSTVRNREGVRTE